MVFLPPNTHNGPDRIAEFSFLFFRNADGEKFIPEEPGKSLSLLFVAERRKYMDSPESTANLDVWLSDDFGLVAMVPIGLQTVGSVVFEEKFRDVEPHSARQVYRGEKLGHFAYGGSTVLLMFEKGRMSAVSVQQGQRIGRMLD